METKKLVMIIAILLASLGLALTGCKKDKNTELPTDTSKLQQLSYDETDVQNVSDEALNDANNVMSGDQLKSSGYLWPCNASIDSAIVAGDTITYFITYDGYNCHETFYRTGKVEVKKKIGIQWYDAGATVIVKLINFKVTRKSTQKSVTLNGTKIFENVNGGLIVQLGYGISSVTHKITGVIQATFDDNTTRTWYVARLRVFTGTFGQYDHLVMTVNGFGSADGYENLVVWGTTRQGDLFYTQIPQPVVYREACEWNPCLGTEIHQIPSNDIMAVITYGYNNNNQLVSGNECPTRYKVDWEKNSHSGTFFLPLP